MLVIRREKYASDIEYTYYKLLLLRINIESLVEMKVVML